MSREQGISPPLTVMPEMWRPTDGMTSSRQKRIRLIPEKMVRFLKMAAARQERQTVLINPPQEAVPVLPERHPAPTNPPEAATAVTAAVENRMPIKATAAKIINAQPGTGEPGVEDDNASTEDPADIGDHVPVITAGDFETEVYHIKTSLKVDEYLRTAL